MKIRLVFEHEITEQDGVGTRYDALNVAVRDLELKLVAADSNDDLAAVFDKVEFLTD